MVWRTARNGGVVRGMKRPLVLVGGYLSQPADFTSLVAALEQPPYNFAVFVTPIGRLQWALTRDWDMRKVINSVGATVERARAESGAATVSMLAYSVGGTLARIYLGDEPYRGTIYGGRRYVDRLITLGTPHHSLERWTRETVGFSNRTYPGAYYAEVRYTSVVGLALQGKAKGTWAERMARSSYALVSGPAYAEAWGDGVTTLECAALGGAEYLVVPDLYHSTFHGRPWYGDAEALPLWGRILNR